MPRRLGISSEVTASVVEDWIKETPVDIRRARLMAHARDEEILVDIAAVMTGGAGNAHTARRLSKDDRGIEKHIAVGHKRQVRLRNTPFLEIERQQGQGVLVIQVRARGQPGGNADSFGHLGGWYRCQGDRRCIAVGLKNWP